MDPRSLVDPRSFVLLLTTALHLVVGGFVYRRNPRGVVHRALLLTTSLAALRSLLTMAVYNPRLGVDLVAVGRVVHAVSLLCGVSFIALALIFPDGQAKAPLSLRRAMWGIAVAVALGCLFTPHMVTSAILGPDERLHATYGWLRYVYFPLLIVGMFWGLIDLTMRFREAHGLRRLQMGYLLGGCALTMALNIPFNIVAPMLGLHNLGWLGPSFSLAFIGMVAHAIVRHRLMGIHLFVGRGVAYGLALGMAIALFLGVLWFLNVLPGATHSPATSAFALVVALLLFQPLCSRIQAGVARYFYRPPYDYQSTVRDTSRALAGTLDLERALSYLLEKVVSTLQVERSLVLIRDRTSQEFPVRATHDGWVEGRPALPEGGGLASASPLVVHLEATHDVIVREEIEQLLSADRASVVTEEMRHFGADVAVPMFSGTILLAVLLVGPKLSGDVFTSQDIDLLSTLGAEGAAAIANAQLHLEAMQAERLATLGGLAAGIAHEVKNPLVAVRTFAELLPDNYGDPEFRNDFSRVVLREVERIDRLIAQLLNYARPAPPHLVPVDLDAVIGETLQLLNYEFTRHRIELSEQCTPGLPPVMADASQLRQVVLNITLNAIQVMPGGGVLRVATQVMEPRREQAGIPYLLPSEAMVEMEIANSGPPIPAGNLDRVFEPFFSTRNGGTGLGLSICKRIITEHKGQIRAVHTGDGMTAFRVRLPAAERPAAAPPEQVRTGELVGRLS